MKNLTLVISLVIALICQSADAQQSSVADQADDGTLMKNSATELKLVPGGTLTRIAKGAHEATYHLHVPADFDATAPPRPILIAFSPGGNGAALVEKLKPATDAVGWLIVGCDKLRNGMKDNDIEIEVEDEILAAVFKHIPHDRDRVYLGGFSGGAMRAYGITARRSEPYAGVLAFGGWLGGPSYQDKPYREDMTVAMVTGVHDLGASGWVPIDTKKLRQRKCTVKHFAFEGGHSVAPAEITRAAVQWLDEQWNQQTQSAGDETKIPLEILYVGDTGDRADDFKTFLSQHFATVKFVSSAELTLEIVNQADVLLLDEIVRSLPEGCTKAMLLTGASAAMTGERYGSKIDWLCQCLDHEAYMVDTSHAIFQGPLPVTPTLVEKRCPHSKLKIQAWKVEEPQDEPGLVSSRKHFSSAKDSEIISGGVNMKGVSGVPLVREANRLLWGFVAPPSQMTEEGRRVFVNSLAWIHKFDGEVQQNFAGLHSRKTVHSVLDSPYVGPENLNRWFTESLIEKSGGDKNVIREHFDGRMDYVHVPTGSGLLQIDKEAEQLGTPIHEVASIEKWINMLDGDQAKLGFRLLQRYTQQRIRRKSKQWRKWFAENKDQLTFDEERGYRFVVKSSNARAATKTTAEDADDLASKLTDVSPILFQTKLAAPHTIDGVAYQYGGWKVTLIITAKVKDGWHFYSATEDNGTNIPTKIEVELPDGCEFVEEWKNPESEDFQLGDGATFRRVIRLGKQHADRIDIKGSVRFQGCTDQRCLPSQTLKFTLPLTIMAK